MTRSPLAARLLADLAARGIEVQLGDAIRYRPRSAMTLALLQRLRRHKHELLAMTMIQHARDRGDADLVERLSEAWMERIAICIEDGKASQETAELCAWQQLRMMTLDK